MTIASNEMFKVLSLRKARELGGATKPPDKRDAARQKIINSQIKEQLSFEDKRTKLQAAKELRKNLLQKVNDLDAIRWKWDALYGQRLKDGYKTYEKNVPDKEEVQVGVAEPGALKKAATFLFGTQPATVQIKKHEPFKPPVVDNDFLTKLGESLPEGQKQILNSLKAEMQVMSFAVAEGKYWSTESAKIAMLQLRQHSLDEADNACRKIHLWENETHRQDTQAAQLQVNGDNRPSVRAIGFGDLIVARERLIGYDAREVAHIENVLPGEERLREHTQTTTREAVTETETEEETRSQKDLETSDRFELETQSQKVINTEMKLDAGVNTSGKYGVTTVETSLEGSLSRSQQESQSAISKLARETVSRTTQEIHKSTRELRRVTVTEQIKELNSHVINGGKFTKGYSGVYYWVEKIHEIELRQYGQRMMVEFFIPEPALSLLPQNAQSTQQFRKPAPVTIGPEDIGEDNYRCLAAIYGAVGVEPPPQEEIQIGYAWGSTPDENAGKSGKKGTGQETKQDYIQIPDFYQPTQAWVAVTGYAGSWAGDQPVAFYDVFLAIGGVGVQFNWTEFDFGGIDLQQVSVEQKGLPLTIRASYIYDQTCTVNIKIICKLTEVGRHAWQLKTFERIKEAHAAIVSDYERQVARAQIQAGIEIKGRPAAENRAREIEELTKWAIKTMRIEPFNFDAIVVQQRQEEIDPVLSDAYAPIMRFFQEAFEWRQMSYILYPYYWGRRDSYGYRSNLVDNDPLHQAFLRAGAARVIVPVTPGFEERVLHYLNTQYAIGLSESEQIAQHLTEIERIDANVAPPSQADNIWLELLLNKNDDLARGSGTLDVKSGETEVTLSLDSLWIPVLQRDVAREIIIEGDIYEITGVDVKRKDPGRNITDADFWENIDADFWENIDTNLEWRKLTIFPAYRGDDDPAATYAMGSVRIGEPWTVRLPTSLVVLAEETSKLFKDIDKKVPLEGKAVPTSKEKQ